MKKVQYMLAALCLAALTLSCQKTAKESEPAQTTRMITITGTIATELPDGTRVSIDNQGKTKWVEGDAIFFHGKYSANGYSATVYLKKEEISEDGKTFTVTIPEFTNGATQEKWADDYNSDSNIIAAYPAQAVGAETTSQNWYTINKFNTSNLPLMSGCNTAYDSCEFVFFNLCGIISFSVDQDFDSYIFMGNASEAVNAVSETPTADDATDDNDGGEDMELPNPVF